MWVIRSGGELALGSGAVSEIFLRGCCDNTERQEHPESWRAAKSLMRLHINVGMHLR